MTLPNIGWACPMNRDIDPRVYQNHMGVLSYTLTKGIAKVEHFIIPINKVIDRARNLIVRKAIRAKLDYVFWVDQDVKIWAHAIEVLLKHKKDIVSGLYFCRKYPFAPCAYTLRPDSLLTHHFNYINDPKGLMDNIGLVGFGCMLTSIEALNIVGYPWFKFVTHDTTEDKHFCLKALANGLKIYVDADLKCTHLGDPQEIGEREFQAAKRYQGIPDVKA